MLSILPKGRRRGPEYDIIDRGAIFVPLIVVTADYAFGFKFRPR